MHDNLRQALPHLMVEDLIVAVHDLQWRSRKLILEVHGIPERKISLLSLMTLQKKLAGHTQP